MIRLTRAAEYGLISLKHLALRPAPEGLSTAREIASLYRLPYEITAKVLQKLKTGGLITSTAGAKGGYYLARPLSEISTSQYLEIVEGPMNLVDCCEVGSTCSSVSKECEYLKNCEIRDFMTVLNSKIKTVLKDVSLQGLLLEMQDGLTMGYENETSIATN